MATVLDASLGFGLENPYGTGVTPVRWMEYSSQSLDFKPARKQSAGYRAGSRVARANRRVTVTSGAGGDVGLDVLSKGLGLWWQCLMGAGSSTLVSTGVYQQVFTLADTFQPFTLQAGVPRLNTDGSATIDPLTYSGCTVPDFELTGGQDMIETRHLFPLMPEHPHTALTRHGSLTEGDVRRLPGDLCATLLSSGVTLPDIESQLLEFAVQQSRGNLSAAARQLGLTRPQGHRLLVNGKSAEHWQTDWNPATQRWQITYNVAPVAGGDLELELENTP